MNYKRHDLHGILIIDKPLGISSMDVVRDVRRAAGHCKTGHAGTLDPLATGVLICCLGKATKRVDSLMGMTKTYQTIIDLSAFTNTDDAEGEPQPVDVATPPTLSQVESAIEQLTGEVKQTPPAYSAIKINGQRAYKLARKGDQVEMPPRIVTIHSITIDHYDWPRLGVTVICGKGTYIRSLGRQIGESLCTGGYLASLRRTAIGDYAVDNAVTLSELPIPLMPEHLHEVMDI